MSCRNPNSEISAENCETLETLGPKNQNARKCNLKLVGGALKEVVHSYALFIPSVQVLSVGTPRKGGLYEISGNPRRVIWFCRNERMTGRYLCNGFFGTYALKPC
jgi:hypothetical protein